MTLFAVANTDVPPRGRALIPTGIATEIPDHVYLRIADRSSMALKGLHVTGGVVDSSYRGEIMVCMENLSDINYVVTEGQKFAQLILERIGNPEVMEVAELTTTERGEQGFGSTGLSAPCRVDLCEPRGDGTLTKADRRTLTEKLAGRILQDVRNTPRAVTDAEITALLRLWPFKRNDRRKKRHAGRGHLGAHGYIRITEATQWEVDIDCQHS